MRNCRPGELTGLEVDQVESRTRSALSEATEDMRLLSGEKSGRSPKYARISMLAGR